MTRYLLALYRDYVVPNFPERTQQVSAEVNALGDKPTDAGAFVFKAGLLLLATVLRRHPGGSVN